MAKSTAPKDLRHINRHYKASHFKSRAEWESYAAWLRRHAKIATGLLPEAVKTPLKAKVWGGIETDEVICEKACFEAFPGFLVTGNVYRPAKPARGKAPGILCPHGHWSHGRFHNDGLLGSVPSRCYMLAQMGATVFSWDMAGMNDSCQIDHHGFKGDEHWGLSLMGLHTLGSVRSLDFLLTLPGVDPKRIGITGCSGGGTQTFMMMAVDGKRLAAAAPICMISYSMQGGCLCENAPLLRIDATSVDLARCFAPKPTFMGSCTGDWTSRTRTEELPAMREIFALYGKKTLPAHLHIDAPHNYNFEMRKSVYGFFNKQLFGARSDRPLHEPWYKMPPMRDRMLWFGRKAPGKIPYAKLRAMWIAGREKALKPCLKDARTARKYLGPLLPHVLGITLTSVNEFASKRPSGIKVTADGASLVVTPHGKPKDRTAEVQHFSAYNRMPVADRIHEVMAAVERAGGKVDLVGKGEAGLWALVAGALSKNVRSLDVQLRGFNPDSKAAWKTRLDVPAIRQIGGMATVMALVGKRPLVLSGATDAVRRAVRKYAR